MFPIISFEYGSNYIFWIINSFVKNVLYVECPTRNNALFIVSCPIMSIRSGNILYNIDKIEKLVKFGVDCIMLVERCT